MIKTNQINEPKEPETSKKRTRLRSDAHEHWTCCLVCYETGLLSTHKPKRIVMDRKAFIYIGLDEPAEKPKTHIGLHSPYLYGVQPVAMKPGEHLFD